MSWRRATRLWAFALLIMCGLAALLNLTVLHDGEVAFAVLLGALVAIAVLVAARPRRMNR